MPSDRRRWCRVCDKHESEVGRISWRGKCLPCGERLYIENIEGLLARDHETLLKWRRGHAAAVGAVLLDDIRAMEQTPET